MKKLLKVIVFVTFPVWVVPVALFGLAMFVWEIVNSFIDDY